MELILVIVVGIAAFAFIYFYLELGYYLFFTIPTFVALIGSYDATHWYWYALAYLIFYILLANAVIISLYITYMLFACHTIMLIISIVYGDYIYILFFCICLLNLYAIREDYYYQLIKKMFFYKFGKSFSEAKSELLKEKLMGIGIRWFISRFLEISFIGILLKPAVDIIIPEFRGTNDIHKAVAIIKSYWYGYGKIRSWVVGINTAFLIFILIISENYVNRLSHVVLIQEIYYTIVYIFS